ncbi:MAG: endonuclease domain-containing protein [Clostridia bacterium]|nr:endonuclease domain-containing protein [Clostridia bacterium]
MLKYKSENKKFARNLRKNSTPWERKLWYLFLKDYKIRFNRQKPIGNYIVDFYCSKAGIIIELDGSQHYSDRQIIYDKERTDYFKSLNLKVIRIINSDIDFKFREVCNYIENEINKRIDKN